MATRRVKKDELKKEYQKERKRILSFVRRAKKRGYLFDENILPKIPKRITEQSINRLKKITPKTLYKKSIYGGLATNEEIVSGKEGRIQEKKKSAEKAKITRKLNREAEQRFFTTDKVKIPKPYPKKSDIIIPPSDIYDSLPEVGAVIFDNTFDEFIQRLSSSVPPTGRPYNAYQQSLYSQQTLISLVNNLLNDYTKSELGYRIRKLEWEFELSALLYGSTASVVMTATYRIEQALTNGNITLQTMKDLAEEAEQREDWNIPS